MLSGEDIISGSIEGDLISGRSNFCPSLTLKPSAVSKASVRRSHRIFPANDATYLITLLIGQVAE